MAVSQSVDWQLLCHAYGSAENIPVLLQQVEAFPIEADWKAEPWFSLWSALYHQGDIFTASIAAVPQIVSALSQAPERATLSFYLLPTSIAVADSENPVEVAPTIRSHFNESVKALGSIAAAALPGISDMRTAKAAQAAVLASQGLYQQAGELLEADA
jgi:hypothetical protein